MTDSTAENGTASLSAVPFISRVRIKNYKSIAPAYASSRIWLICANDPAKEAHWRQQAKTDSAHLRQRPKTGPRAGKPRFHLATLG
jgi:hypothetical protein